MEADERVSANAGVESLTGYITSIPAEPADHGEARHAKIAERRGGAVVIVHRGAWAFALENTLEAYAAAMDCGADGCEIDIRRTADGVLVMFHDDGLDRMTDALGRVDQHSYVELLAIKFRAGYRTEADTQIPALAAVLELARRRAMLLHLDVKEPGLEEDIARLLDSADMWDHVVEINESNAAALRKNPKARHLAYKAFGWQEGRMDMSPEKVRDGLAKPGNMIMVDDPRVAARELKRKAQRVPLPDGLRAPWPAGVGDAGSRSDANSLSPTVYLRSVASRVDSRSLDELGKLITADFPERTDLEGDAAVQARRARWILERAWAAQKIGELLASEWIRASNRMKMRESMSLRAQRSNLPSSGLRLLRRCAPRNDMLRLILLEALNETADPSGREKDAGRSRPFSLTIQKPAGDRSTRAVRWLEELVVHRSLHPDWAYSGLDGAMAARALGALGATESVPLLVRTFLAVDPDLKKLVKPPANYPFAWADYRMKGEIIRVLGELPCEASRRFLRDYLAMDEATAGKSAAPLFEEATRTFLRQEVATQELRDLLRSANSGVRGTAILVCLDEGPAARTAVLREIMPWTQDLPQARR